MKLEETIEVIGKLTKSEKRSISITLTRMSKSEDPTEQHYRLYNLLSSIVKDSEKPKNFAGEGQEKIDSQKKYIEDRINEEKQKEPKLFTSLNVIRLYDFILSNLRSLNADRPTFKLSNYLQDIQILEEKGMSDQALRLIAKAKKEAREEDSSTGDLEHLYFLFLERRIHLRITKERNFGVFKALHGESQNQFERIKFSVDAKHDQELIQGFVHTGEKIPEAVINEVSDTFKLMLEKPEASSKMPLDAAMAELSSTVLYLKSREANSKDESQKEYFKNKILKQLGQINALFDEDKRLRHPKTFSRAVNIIINYSIEKGLSAPIESYKGSLMKAIGLNPDVPIEGQVDKIIIDKHTPRDYFTHVFTFISYTIGIKKFDLASKIISHIKDLIEEYQPPQGHLLAFYLQFASVCFLLREFKSAKVYVKKILETDYKEPRKDVIFEAELLDTLVDYEIDADKGESSTVYDKATASLQKLTDLKNSKVESYEKRKIESATILLTTLLQNIVSGKDFTIAELQDLYKIQTKAMGDFITDVFALWTQQKMQSL